MSGHIPTTEAGLMREAAMFVLQYPIKSFHFCSQGHTLSILFQSLGAFLLFPVLMEGEIRSFSEANE